MSQLNFKCCNATHAAVLSFQTYSTEQQISLPEEENKVSRENQQLKAFNTLMFKNLLLTMKTSGILREQLSMIS